MRRILRSFLGGRLDAVELLFRSEQASQMPEAHHFSAYRVHADRMPALRRAR